MRTSWTNGFESKTEQEKLQTILDVCRLETHNSVYKDDLIFLLRWLAEQTIVEEDND